MKKNRGKLIAFLLMILFVILTGGSTFAHSGRTDSSGGHKDNQNKSGLGSYHYHCGGHPAHLHKNGVCPYASKSSSKNSSTKSSTKSNKASSSSSTKSSAKSGQSNSSSSKKATSTTPKTVYATSVKINEKIDEMEVGKFETLTATISPSNATNQTITWKSSDTDIATVNSSGKITAKRAGSVNITASTSNGKSSTIKLKIKEEAKNVENTIVAKTSFANSTNGNNTLKNTTMSNEETTNPAGTLIALGLVGGGGYWFYKKKIHK